MAAGQVAATTDADDLRNTAIAGTRALDTRWTLLISPLGTLLPLEDQLNERRCEVSVLYHLFFCLRRQFFPPRFLSLFESLKHTSRSLFMVAHTRPAGHAKYRFKSQSLRHLRDYIIPSLKGSSCILMRCHIHMFVHTSKSMSIQN